MTSTDQPAVAVPGDLTLAGDFPQPTFEEWEIAVAKVLNRGRPEDRQLSPQDAVARLRTTTVDGLVIEPLYLIPDEVTSLGAPDVEPFTRGASVRSGDMDAWDVRALHEDPDVDRTRKAIATDLERGATSIWLRVDPDAIQAETLRDVLGDVLLELAKIDVSSRTDPEAAAEALLDVFKDSDKPKNHLSLNLGLDPIGFAALHGTTPDLSGLARWVKDLQGFDKSRAIVIDGTTWHNAGAGDVHEVAWLLGAGVEYVRALVEAGISADDAFDAITFRVTATTDQFATIARLRALRLCWDRIGEEFGVAADKRGARQHAVTSWRELTRDDPHVNILRGSIATFAAAVGGAEAVTVLPFDTVWGLPTDFSRRVARNTQIVLAEESNIGRVNDPAGGSWYVEDLTNQIAHAAWTELQRVEGAGGLSAALESGSLAEELDKLNAERAKRLATRKAPITAVSEFPKIEQPDVEVVARPEAPALGGLAWHRDAEVFEALRDRTWSVKDPGVFLACLGTRRDYGAREGFASNLFHVGAIPTPECDGGDTASVVEAFKAAKTPVACLCSSKKVYAEQGLEVAQALKQAGAKLVYLAGNVKEFGDDASAASDIFDGTVALGCDVVSILTTIIDTLGADA